MVLAGPGNFPVPANLMPCCTNLNPSNFKPSKSPSRPLIRFLLVFLLSPVKLQTQQISFTSTHSLSSLSLTPPAMLAAAAATPTTPRLLPTPKTPHSKPPKPTPRLPPPLRHAPLTISPLSTAAAAATTFFLDSQVALAAGGEFGILEGRTLALIHPVVMGGLFVYTLWAGYLGWQWRRVRTIQDEINELKKQVKLAAPAPAAVPAGADVPPPPPAAAAAAASPVELKIQQLTEERKELLKGSYRDRHFNAGSLLLGFGVFEAVGGGVNTYLRTGKLFPGPHLYAGAAITVLWAAAAALVPAMQKGNDTARSLHIALNTLNVLLFVSQIPTGLDIVFKVFEFTKWP